MKYEPGRVFSVILISSSDHVSFVSAQNSRGLEELGLLSISKSDTDKRQVDSMSSLISLPLVKSVLIIIFLERLTYKLCSHTSEQSNSRLTITTELKISRFIWSAWS